MIFSVLICTYNRADYVGGSIESCLCQTFDENAFEIVVVDNNSTDGTREVVERYRQRYPNIRYVRENTQGLNMARTTGAETANGKYIAYLDDDARADPGWLASLLAAFEEHSPRPVCVGGRVLLDWGGPRPGWFPREFDSLHAFVDHGKEGFYLRPATRGHFLIGTNMAFLRNTVLELGGFRTHTGRLKRRTISGAETEMINRLLRAGLPVFYSPDPIVNHIVVPERRTRRFLIRRVRGDGATQPLLDLDSEEFRSENLARRILYDGKIGLKLLLGSVWHFLLGNRKQSFLFFLGAVQKWGRTEMELRFIFDREFSPLWRNRRSSKPESFPS